MAEVKCWKRGKNEPVKNVDLWKRLLEAKEPHNVTFIWVKGHDGHPQNERCDALATGSGGRQKTWQKKQSDNCINPRFIVIQSETASKTGDRGCRGRKAAGEESPGFTGQDAG